MKCSKLVSSFFVAIFVMSSLLTIATLTRSAQADDEPPPVPAGIWAYFTKQWVMYSPCAVTNTGTTCPDLAMPPPACTACDCKQVPGTGTFYCAKKI